jgi:hypothetical protein
MPLTSIHEIRFIIARFMSYSIESPRGSLLQAFIFDIFVISKSEIISSALKQNKTAHTHNLPDSCPFYATLISNNKYLNGARFSQKKLDNKYVLGEPV